MPNITCFASGTRRNSIQKATLEPVGGGGAAFTWERGTMQDFGLYNPNVPAGNYTFKAIALDQSGPHGLQTAIAIPVAGNTSFSEDDLRMTAQPGYGINVTYPVV
ncbi:hypothetical protein E1162_07890 [Rhodobacteraceae bacterium RKSG542]|uniref:hypothetical protein n=1 Tax=Pseudovibrio flavus TaxID=2529854 RepID=UPI0012BB7CF8|nr:hypothetical protein [Pseudovibrio flavus]MTI17160.1 hypothetical protein [Pseudovibrio flavus]